MLWRAEPKHKNICVWFRAQTLTSTGMSGSLNPLLAQGMLGVTKCIKLIGIGFCANLLHTSLRPCVEVIFQVEIPSSRGVALMESMQNSVRSKAHMVTRQMTPFSTSRYATPHFPGCYIVYKNNCQTPLLRPMSTP